MEMFKNGTRNGIHDEHVENLDHEQQQIEEMEKFLQIEVSEVKKLRLCWLFQPLNNHYVVDPTHHIMSDLGIFDFHHAS